jgi:anti-anti-sigma regulatory factor
MMRTHNVTLILAGSALLVVGGCPFDARLTNQGGGSIFTAVGKIVDQRLSRLTPDEVQILTDTVSDLAPQVSIFVEDEEAQAAVDFLDANGLDTIDDLAQFAEDAAADPRGVSIPESLEQLIESGIDLESIVQVAGQ